ncbi:fibronectin type III domain-containing protein [Runella sp.]|uniref:fibronectin type III domain-containing protein n=1 Tax=Runella sp. TaxID=1960881 RepID=UPI003D0EA31D
MRSLVFLLALSGLFCLNSFAQTTDNYPVQTTVYFGGPSSQRLSEWFTSDKRLFILLQLKDLTKPSVSVYLRWQLEGPGIRIATREGYLPPAFFSLTPGLPARLNGTDLAAHYFAPSVLQTEGLDLQEAYNASLPEGFYTFSVQAFEASTGQVVSNTAQTFLVLSSPQPPMLNLPANGSSVPANALQKVLFQWTPRHFATPQSQVVYRLKVCRVPDNEEPNEQTMLTCVTPVLDKTDPGTSLTGDMTGWFQPLEAGQRYAVQVQAIDLNNQLTNFANQGYSQVQWFRYGQACLPPSSFTLQSVSSDRVRLLWEARPQAQAYVVEYKAETATEWTSVKVYGTTYMVAGLENKTTYLFRLRSDCDGLLPSAPSEEQEWNISAQAPETAPEWPGELLQPELINVQTLDMVAVPVTILQELYVNFPVQASTPPGAPNAFAPTSGTSSGVSTNVPLTTKLKIPDCALRAGSFVDCQPTHPIIPLPTGEELTSLSVGDVLGIYDFALIVTKIGEGPGFSGEGLVRLPFLGNAMMPMEFKGVRAKKGEEGTHGGCVYAIDAGGYVQSKNNVSAEELMEQRQSLIQAVLRKSNPAAFAGTLQQALQSYNGVAKEITEAKQAGQSVTPEQVQQIMQYTAAILQGSGALKTQLNALGTDDETVTTLLKDLKALTDELTAHQATINKGRDVPVIADLKAKYQALFDRLKQLTASPIEPPAETPTGRITNVSISGIEAQSAKIGWTGDKAFAKYTVIYAAEGEGELTQTVTSPQLTLTTLKPGRKYTYKIVGYSETGEVADTYGTGTFSTPDNLLPPPENVISTVQTDGSVKITWKKNSLHQSFKLTYKDTDGELRTLYPTTNSAVIAGLPGNQVYPYSIVAFGSEQRSSTAADGDFQLGTVCRAAISSVPLRVVEGTLVTLKVETCPTGSVRWQIGDNPSNVYTGSTITHTPLQTTTYQSFCTLTIDGRSETCSESVQIVVDRQCKGVTASVSAPQIEPGQSVLLRSSGCSGDIQWKDGYPAGQIVGRESSLFLTPNATQTYTLSCVDQTGQQCTVDVGSVKVSCHFQLAVTGRSALNKSDRTIIVQAVGCEGTVNWGAIDGGNGGIRTEYRDPTTVIYSSVTKGFTVNPTCLATGCKATTGYIEAPPKSTVCNQPGEFDLTLTTETYNTITLKVTTSLSFQWDDAPVSDKLRTIPKPQATRVFSIHTDEGCKSSFTYQPSNQRIELLPCLLFQLSPNYAVQIPADQSSKALTMTAGGCSNGVNAGTVTWKDAKGTVMTANTTGALTVNYTNADVNKQFTYTATCSLFPDAPKSTIVSVTKQAPALPKNPCDFAIRTANYHTFDTFLPDLSDPIRIDLFGKGDYVQVFIQEGNNPLTAGYDLTVDASDKTKATVIIKKADYVREGSFLVKITNFINGVGNCDRYVYITVSNNKSSSNAYYVQYSTDPKAAQSQRDCGNYRNGTVRTTGYLNTGTRESVDALMRNTTVDLGVISFLTVNSVPLTTQYPTQELGLVDKVCNADPASTLEWFTAPGFNGRIDRRSDSPVRHVRVPKPTQTVTYYGRCTFANGSYCETQLTLQPTTGQAGGGGANGREGVGETTQSTTAQAPCVSSKREAAQRLLSSLLCNKISLLPVDDNAKLEAVRQTLQSQGFDLAPVTPQMAADLAAGKCSEVIEALTNALTGDENTDALNEILGNADALAGEAVAALLPAAPTVDDPDQKNAAPNGYYYLTSSGGPLLLPAGAELVFFKDRSPYPNGTLQGFKLPDGRLYYADIVEGRNTFSGYRLMGDASRPPKYYPVPKLSLTGPQKVYKLNYVEANGQCGYQVVESEYEFKAVEEGKIMELINPAGVVKVTYYRACEVPDYVGSWTTDAQGIKHKTVVIQGSTFYLTEQNGDITVTGRWKTFSKCATCGKEAQGALDNALKKARATNGKITESTLIVTQQDQSYGDAGVISYSEMKLMDILKNLATTYNSLVDKAKVPEAVWKAQEDLPAEDKNFFVQDKTRVISGAVDQAIEEARDLPELVGLGLKVASDPQGAYDQLSTFAQQMSWQKAKDFAKEAVKSTVQYDYLTNPKNEYKLYGTGRLGVSIVKLAAGGAALKFAAIVKKAPDFLALWNRLRDKMDNLSWTQADKDRFRYDFETVDESILKRFDEGGDLDLNASKALDENKNLRRILGNLQTLTRLKSILPSDLSMDDIKGLIINSSNKQDILAELAKFDAINVDELRDLLKKRGLLTVAVKKADVPFKGSPNSAVLDQVTTRQTARQASQNLDVKSPTYDADYKAQMKAMRDASEKSAELMADIHFGKANEIDLSLPNTTAKQGQFDRVYKTTDPQTGAVTWHVVECKGGAAELGSRQGHQQCTKPYIESVIANLNANITKLNDTQRANLRDLQSALNTSSVRSYRLKQPFTDDGTLGNTEITEFNL